MIECRNHRMRGADADTSERVSDSQSIPKLMTQDELIRFLHTPEISKAKDQHNVIEHLEEVQGSAENSPLQQTPYPLKAILAWIEKQTVNGK